MPSPHEYATPQGFQRALLAHLRKRAGEEQVDPQRLQRLVAFDRFLARLLESEHIPWVVKGGYALELRLHGRARATKDIDLAIPHPSDLVQVNGDAMVAAHDLLQRGAERDLSDHFTFVVGPPTQDLEGPPYGGARFKVEARIGARPFSTFQLDMSLGDAVIYGAEWLTAQPLLDFAGLPPVRLPVLPAEQQFAEKVHAYTLPRGDLLNSRVKDLVDLVLFIELGQMDRARVVQCVLATFTRRKTHGVPAELVTPPLLWAARYMDLATECHLQSATLQEGFSRVAAYWSQLELGV